MSRDPMGYALSAVQTLASSPIIDRLGARKLVEKLAYQGTKTGFKVITTSSRQFQTVVNLVKPVRLDQPQKQQELFDISITDEQQMIRDSVKKLAVEVLRVAAEKSDEDRETTQEVKQQVAELGLMFYAVPEEFGGAGVERSPLTSMLIAEDLAYGDMGQAVALLSSMGVANALTQWGSAEQQSKYLSAFLDESTPLQATIAVNEPTPLFDPNKLDTQATLEGDSYVINGVKSMVPVAKESELFLVAANVPGQGPQIFVVEGNCEGLSIEQDHGMGIRASGVAKLVLNNVKVARESLLGNGEFNYQSFIDYARLSWCALAIGTGQAVLDYVAQYVNEREAFGEPISHRQSVAFMVANIAIELEGMRIITQRAVARAEAGEDFHEQAYLARVACADKAMEIGTNGVQLVGGHGFTKEHPVERWYRDLRAIGIMEGGLHL